MQITTGWLEAHSACPSGVEAFERVFGGSARLTRANLMRAAAAALDIDWLAEQVLSTTALAKYDKARAAARAKYDKAHAPARAEYDKACAAARAEYDKAHAAAWAEYDKARAAARAEYDKAHAAAWAEYDKACAAALANALGLR